MTMIDIADLVSMVFFFLASLLCLAASLGILRFPDLLSRMHAVTKPQVLGTLFALIGMGLAFRDVKAAGILILIGLFQLVTVPITSHMMSRAALRAGQIDLEHGGRDVVIASEDELTGRETDSIVVSPDDELGGSA